jgi:hypothetical protein
MSNTFLVLVIRNISNLKYPTFIGKIGGHLIELCKSTE